MNTAYLGNHSQRLTHLTELREGEMYVIGRGKDAFIAFVMPGKEKTKRDEDSYTFKKITVYEARLKSCGQEIDAEQIKTADVQVDEFLDVEVMGVFSPTRGSQLRKTIEQKLGVLSV